MNPLLYLAIGIQIGVVVGVAIMCLLIINQEKHHDKRD